jgi:hypothetical protein
MTVRFLQGTCERQRVIHPLTQEVSSVEPGGSIEGVDLPDTLFDLLAWIYPL